MQKFIWLVNEIKLNLRYLNAKKHLILFGLLCVLGFVACKPEKKFPLAPTLEFISLEKIDNGTGIDDNAILKLYFTDGDGNVGLDPTDNYPPFDTLPYSNNFFVVFKAKRNGEFVAMPEYEFCARLPRFLSSDTHKPIEGEIEYIVTIRNPIPLPSVPPIDTIMFECWLLDRDLNESNHVFTKEITVVNRLSAGE